mmetsp:Transcript_6100/g.10416  ORF Transcript_6100/g.10416 Transcript_6100/m.10416 type:complete len:616 (+) Transcript_6100:8057-9904(+)
MKILRQIVNCKPLNNNMISRIIFAFVTICTTSCCAKLTYRGAVGTYEPRQENSAAAFEKNTKAVIQQIKEAAAQGAQIIIFPEVALNANGLTPIDCSWKTLVASRGEAIPVISNSSSEYEIPCGDSNWDQRPITQMISCAARTYGIYVLVHLYGAQPCTKEAIGDLCPPGGVMSMSMNVVLNSKGALVARYFKRSIALEAPGITQPTPELLAAYPDNPIFTANFNGTLVTFGMMICYDLLQAYPLNKYLDAGISNLLWVNSFPANPSTITQTGTAQGTSWATNTNILSTGKAGQGSENGMGIFTNGKDLAMLTQPAKCTGLSPDELPKECITFLVADIPIVPATLPLVTSPYTVDKHIEYENEFDVVECPMLSFDAFMATYGKGLDINSYAEYIEFTKAGKIAALCRRIELRRDVQVSAEVQLFGVRGETICKAIVEGNNSNQVLYLMAGGTYRIPATPCGVRMDHCNLITEAAFASSDITSPSIRLNSFEVTKTSVYRDGRVIPSVVGENGQTLSLSKFDVQKYPSKLAYDRQTGLNFTSATILTIDSKHHEWPNCNECYDTRRGYPQGRNTSLFPPPNAKSTKMDKLAYGCFCKPSECLDPHGFWPPPSTILV